MDIAALSDKEFNLFQGLIYKIAGISLSPVKKPLVSGRLMKRLQERQVNTYSDYFKLLNSGHEAGEIQMAVDLLTTNETYFFRESQHFDFLRQQLLRQRRKNSTFRVWSAACSSGQEPYTIAMVLAEHFGDGPWEVFASDISTRVLERARGGHYPLEQAEHIPKSYLGKYCLKGTGSQEGTFLVTRSLRARVTFMQVNLNTTLPKLGDFDAVFLRNVMIYFNEDTKRQVVRRIMWQLKSGGHLLIGHSESLNGIVDELKPLMPSVYLKP
ncbi:MAG: protein-glutamate O-methyltransferase CheR [Sulfuricella sp.]|nr:protein-glutamate O-methyltransferase CheR [Sulfuricella sp.]